MANALFCHLCFKIDYGKGGRISLDFGIKGYLLLTGPVDSDGHRVQWGLLADPVRVDCLLAFLIGDYGFADNRRETTAEAF
jgi:hypothetical protein